MVCVYLHDPCTHMWSVHTCSVHTAASVACAAQMPYPCLSPSGDNGNVSRCQGALPQAQNGPRPRSTALHRGSRHKNSPCTSTLLSVFNFFTVASGTRPLLHPAVQNDQARADHRLTVRPLHTQPMNCRDSRRSDSHTVLPTPPPPAGITERGTQAGAPPASHGAPGAAGSSCQTGRGVL